MNTTIRPTTLAEMLRAHAAHRGSQIAIRFPSGDGHWDVRTFAELDAEADALAAGFRAEGLCDGAQTLLLLKPSIRFYPTVFGLIRAGAVPVFIDPGMGIKSALRCVEGLGPEGMIAAPPVHAARQFLRRPFASVTRHVTDGRRWFWGGTTLDACRRADLPSTPSTRTPDDPAVLVFTSGSTGPAKPVCLTHRCLTARVESVQSMFDLRAGSTIVETLLVYTILEICMGLTVVVPQMDVAKPSTLDPEAFVSAIKRFEARIASGSPVVWQNVARYGERHGISLRQLELLLTSAAPIPVDLHQRLRDQVTPNAELFTPYGATEALPLARIGSDEILQDTAAHTGAGAGTCVGHVSDDVDVRILQVTDGPILTWDDALECPAGEIGEIVVSGPTVSLTYIGNPAHDHAAKIPDGDRVWHRMGDLGYFDADGRLWFCGRKSHRLETAGGMIPPVPVEGVFNRHPAVLRTALVGQGPSGAETPVLCVELEEGVRWTPDLERDIAALAEGTRWETLDVRLLPHPAFPTDTRHNSKIRREDLKTWAKAA